MSGLAFENAEPAGQIPSDPRANATRGHGNVHGNGHGNGHDHAEPERATQALSEPAPGMPYSPADSGTSDVAIADWDTLFSAVEARLTSTVDELIAALPATSASTCANQVRISVLECVAALHQLHSTVAHELARRQCIEIDLADAHRALAQARIELAGPAHRREPSHMAAPGGQVGQVAQAAQAAQAVQAAPAPLTQ